MEDVTVAGLLETMFVLADEAESSAIQAVVRRTIAVIATRREVAVEPVLPESQNWWHDLVIIGEILLAGNYRVVMVNSYPKFMFMEYICV